MNRRGILCNAGVGVLFCALLATETLFSAECAFRLADAGIVYQKTDDVKEAAALGLAARDLAGIIRNVTGKEPSVAEEGAASSSGGAVIYLGDTEAARSAGLNGEGLRNGDWRVKTEAGRAYLYGRTAFAAEGALVDFADRYLDYHVVFADGHDVYQKNPALDIPVGDFTVRPAIYGRDLYHAMFNGRLYPETKHCWERYSRLTLSTVPRTIEAKYRLSRRTRTDCHSQFDYLPPKKYFADHPEYYSMDEKGNRRGIPNAQSQLCFTNPDTYRLVLESLRGFVAADRRANPTNYPCVYDFTQLDNSSFLCCCPQCRKVIAKYNRVPGGHAEGGDAGLQLEFANRLARDIRAEYPDVQIRIFAYVSTECAPKPGTIAVEPNIVIWWCDVYSHSDDTLPLETSANDFNPKQAKELKEWFALTSNIQIWDYMLAVGAPSISPDAIKSDAALYAEGGVPLIFMEMENRNAPLYELNFYLLSRLYINPKYNLERLLRIYCRGYGRGADDMYEGLQYLRGEILAHPAKSAADWHSRNLPWLNAEVIRKFGASVKAAYAKEDDPIVRGRTVRLLACLCRQLITIYRKDPKAAKELEAAIAGYRKFGKLSAEQSFMEESQRAREAAGVEEAIELLTLKFNDLPAELERVPRDELVCVDWHYRRDGSQVEDPASERGRSVQFDRKGAVSFGCGLYDETSKLSSGYRIELQGAADGKFRWYKLGKGRLERNTIFWFPGSWRCSFLLKDFFVISDGAAVDPNNYEVWASVRFSADTIAVDRLALRRFPRLTRAREK